MVNQALKLHSRIATLTNNNLKYIMVITVQTIVKAPLSKVWECWTKPEHIVNWNFASDDWECPRSENDVRVGGKFSATMAAKDKSFSFDFAGTYTNVKENELIEYNLGDERHVKVEISESPEGVKIVESFDAEETHSEEMQRAGWQSILDNFKKYTESQK